MSWPVRARAKTSVLVERYLKLVEEDGVPLDRLLALTFTLKAAGEMRERIRREIERRRPELRAASWARRGFSTSISSATASSRRTRPRWHRPRHRRHVAGRLRAHPADTPHPFESGRLENMHVDFGEQPPTPGELGPLFDS